MQENYWRTTLNRRISRRSGLAATATGATAAAFLAACGGGSDSGSSEVRDTSSLVVQPRDTFREAKRGGILKDHVYAQPRSFDTINPQADYNYIAPEVYGNLLVETPGKLKSSEYVLQGDAAQSYEISPDGLQITFKLRPGVKFHNKPPVNGRAMDTDDVLFSLNRYAELAPLRSLVFNKASPDAPVLSMASADKSTLLMKLKEPVSYAVNWFASFGSFTGGTIIVPKEADGGFDIRLDMIGHGPFQLKSHAPSVNFVLERNPDYYNKDFALIDGVELPIIGEYAQRLSQLKAGNLHYLVTVRAEDALAVKRDQPKIDLYESEFVTTANPMTFGHMPVGSSKFNDVRVRQAFSMALDRDLFIDVKYNADNFRKEGLPVKTEWNSHLAAREPYVAGGWRLDPRGKDFGPNAKYFKFDITEAKRLLAAAGLPTGFDVTVQYPATPQYNLTTDSEPILGFFQALGVKVNARPIQDYTQDYIPNDRDASGAFEGIGIHSVTGSTPSVVSPVSALVAEYWPKSGVTFHGFDVNGRGDKSGDPELNGILEKMRLERDTNAAKKLAHDAQRHLGKMQHALIFPGGATGFYHAWPALRNFRVWRGVQAWGNYQLWLDQAKAPFA